MSIRAKLLASAASAGVLFLGWQLGTAQGETVSTGTNTRATPSTTTQTQSGTSPQGGGVSSFGIGSTDGAAPSPGASSTSGSTGSATATTLKDGTYTGQTVTHRYGSVQVTATVAGGKLSGVTESVQARDGHSQQINSYAIPTLRSEVQQAGSADVSTVSGATYTSEAYLESLQSALDQAK